MPTILIESIEKFENWSGKAAVLNLEGVYIVLICTLFAAAAAPAALLPPGVPPPPAITIIVPSGFIL